MTDESAVSNGGTASTYAVIKTGGKQYRVKVGDRIAVERLADEAGNDITLDQVLLVGDKLPYITALFTINQQVAETLEGMYIRGLYRELHPGRRWYHFVFH